MAKVIILFLLISSTLFGSAGQITEISGPTQITRGSDKIKGALKVGIESNDKIETLNSKTGITFADDTHVTISEHSKLLIDDFVYDSKSSSGKIGLKAPLGTVRYFSGKIAHNNHNNVNVRTPTASIAVRGTDFSMVVDETGKSLIILLPTKIGNKYVVGKIDVTTLAGTVTLDQAFQGTVATSFDSKPSAPVIFKLEGNDVDNSLILSNPKKEDTALEKAQAAQMALEQEQQQRSAQLYATTKAIERIDAASFIFVQAAEDASKNKLKSNFKGNVISITVPNGENITVNYKYQGGNVSAKNGTGTGVIMNIEQR
jgi:biotin carboxyl carrier protein